MTLRQINDYVCWEIVDQNGEHTGEEGWAHYSSELKAHQDLMELLREQREYGAGYGGTPRIWKVVQSFPTPCVGLYCDGEGCPDDPCDMSDGGWTHLDPADPLPFPLADMEWLDDSDERVEPGKHYCLDHHPAWPEDEDGPHIPHIEGQLELPE